MSFQPNPRQALVMWYLLITHEEPAQSKVNLPFTVADRKELLSAGLIQLEKRKRAQHLVLTDKAWDWALEHLDAPISKSQQAAPILQTLLTSVKQFLQAQNVPLVELLALPVRNTASSIHTNGEATKPLTTVDLPARIRSAYKSVSGGQSHTRVRLVALRSYLADLSRAEVDRALIQMQLNGSLTLMRLDDPQSITAEDAAAALDIHGDKQHIVYLKG